MHVLEMLIRGKHSHKVSFDKDSDPTLGMQANEQHAASTGKAEGAGNTAAAAAAAQPAHCTAASAASIFQEQLHQQLQHHQQLQLQQQLQPAQPPQQQSAGESHQLKSELKKLLRRAAVSFRDLNISVHEASNNSLLQLHDTAGATAAPHTHTGASVLGAGRQRVAVEQKKLAIIMVRQLHTSTSC